jgi:hypothetical protein
MKPLNCCNGCERLNADGTFKNLLRCMLCENYAIEYAKILYNEQKKERGCSTCKHCVRVRDFPSFVTAEECDCSVGLECDTVLFNVKNCPKWIGKHEEWSED